MSTRAQLSETIHRLLPGEANKRIREAILAAANYSGQRTDQLRQSIDEANRIRTGVLVDGTLEFTSDTNADLTGWAWASNFAVKQQDGPESITVLAPNADYTRPDYFIGMPDGSIDYRPSTIDIFGNSIPPDVDSDEVILSIVQRNPDGSTTDVDPALPVASFTDTIYQTANQENTVGKYALVWEGTLYPNGNYQIHLLYGATSADPDWETSAPGKSGIMVLNIFPHEGLSITGHQFYTVDPNSEEADWVLIRTGEQLKLYHHSTQYWMRVKFRVLYNNFTEVIAGFRNFEDYTTLPTGDQVLESAPISVGGGTSLDPNIVDALEAANTPDAENPFATMADIPADELTADELAAIQGANSPSGSNVFATMADVGGGGADPNAVHYNAADGKSASEQKQARTNIGSTDTTPQTVAISGSINNLVRSSNFIVFNSPITLTGIANGVIGDEVFIYNNSGGVLIVSPQDTLSTDINRFAHGDRIPSGSFQKFKYANNRWGICGNTLHFSLGNDAVRDLPTVFGDLSTLGWEVGIALGVRSRSNNSSQVVQQWRDYAGATIFRIFNDGIIVGSNRFHIGGAGGLSDTVNSLRSTLTATNIRIFRIDDGGGTKFTFWGGGSFSHSRSNASDRSIRRDEQRLYYLVSVTTSGAINNQALTDGIFNFRFTACTDLTGVANGEIGRRITIQNDRAGDLIIHHEDAASIAANRFNLIGAADLTIPTKGKADFEYCTGSRWELVSKNF